MNCHLCDSKVFKVIFDYDKPDKYEKWVGINTVSRQWVRCIVCGAYLSVRNYNLKDLEVIYKTGYRDQRFRGETIDKVYEKIMALPSRHSENNVRCDWLMNKTEPCKILDIGSGLGVFPSVMDEHGYVVDCVEENQDSISFLSGLGFKCYESVPYSKYDMVSIIHVLEHIEDPLGFLCGLKRNIGVWLFIEVPNSLEFGYLDKNNDEFNSCHVKFYSVETLKNTIEKAGYSIINITEKHYKTRNLSRILALCR